MSERERDWINTHIQSYTEVKPDIFRPMDIVEVQISFVSIALASQRNKVILVMRAITLLDGSLADVSDNRTNLAEKHRADLKCPNRYH